MDSDQPIPGPSGQKSPRTDAPSEDGVAEESPIYPSEIWEHIFQNLAGLQLLRSRLVCRRWRDIITECPSLTAKLKVCLGKMNEEEYTLEDDRQAPFWLPPVRDISISNYEIVTVNSWWPAAGQKLTHLTLYSCRLEATLLFSMLGQTPNLRSLHLQKVQLSRVGEAEEPLLRLSNLRDLRLEDPYMLRHVERMFPRLRDLCVWKVVGLDLDRLVQSVHALQDTLEGFKIKFAKEDPRADILQELTKMDRLHLKRTSFHLRPGFVWKDYVSFLRVQPQLEEIVIYGVGLAHASLLSEVGKALPRLKSLTCRIRANFEMGFLRHMPNLERLEVRGKPDDDDDDYPEARLTSSGSPSLHELVMSLVIIQGVFVEFLEQSPMLCSVALEDCSVDFGISGGTDLKQLRILRLTDYEMNSTPSPDLLIRRCPALEEVELNGLGDESTVLFALQHLKRLRKLTLRNCCIDDEFAGQFLGHATSLEMLTIGSDVLSSDFSYWVKNLKIRVVEIMDRETKTDYYDDDDGWRPFRRY